MYSSQLTLHTSGGVVLPDLTASKEIDMNKYAIEYMWSDTRCWEVVNEISDKTIEIRLMDQGFKYENGIGSKQNWWFKSDENAAVIRIRKSKKDNIWIHKGMKFLLSENAHAYQDPTF
jgi:hypothetical protein